MRKSLIKITTIIIANTFFISSIGILLYLKAIPAIVRNNYAISKVEKIAGKITGTEIKIKNPVLKTAFSPDISFSVDLINIKKNNENLLNISNMNTEISLEKIFKHSIIVKKFGIDYIFADINKLTELFPSKEANNKQKESNWDFDFYDSVLSLNKSLILYKIEPDTFIKLRADNLNVDNTQKIERFVHFDFDADIVKNNNTVRIAFADDNKVVIKNKHLYINNCPFSINNSKMFFNAQAGKDNKYSIEVYADRFFIPDIIKLLQTNIIENNINEILEYIKDINGDFDFKVKLSNNDLTGNIKFNKISGKLAVLNNLPFMINSGDINLNAKDLTLTNFKGFYDKSKLNDFEIEGHVNDYLKTMDSEINITTTLTNDFMKDYLSKVAGISMELIGKSKTKIIVHFINNILDITMMGKLAQGNDILIEGASLTPTSYDRAFKADFHINGNNLNIETINYYIAKEITKERKGIKPILTLDGNINIPDGKILDLGFNIPNPLPSEFLNVLIGQKLFKGGKFSGNLHYQNDSEIPKIEGNMQAEKIRIPSQRLFLKEGSINTDKNLIKIFANGRYKRSSYDFSGTVLNKIIFPIVIKDTALTLDNIDIEKIMKTVNSPVQNENDLQKAYNNSNDEQDTTDDTDDDTTQTFDLKNLIIEKCIVKIIKGKYKDINFGNIEARMSLDKDSVFKLNSNRFDIAEGISSADVNCDLKNQKYHLKLGIKDVDSNIMSSSILNLKKEISGKASGLIDLNTDESLKLNGEIKFLVKNGSIPKVGLLEYVFKFASLFRNPIAMISPSIFSDLVNIPEGNFDKITGNLKLKDNRIELMKIKSYSPQLSSYIVGCYNIENSDAILRIYTKFSNRNKGFAGILRNISLNSLANRIPTKNRNDINYYAAELAQLPKIDAEEKDCQIFLTKVDGDVEHNNFISSLKKIK